MHPKQSSICRYPAHIDYRLISHKHHYSVLDTGISQLYTLETLWRFQIYEDPKIYGSLEFILVAMISWLSAKCNVFNVYLQAHDSMLLSCFSGDNSVLTLLTSLLESTWRFAYHAVASSDAELPQEWCYWRPWKPRELTIWLNVH